MSKRRWFPGSDVLSKFDSQMSRGCSRAKSISSTLRSRRLDRDLFGFEAGFRGVFSKSSV